MSLIIALLISSSSFAAQTSGPQFVSLAKGFATFVNESRGASLDAQQESWNRNVESQRPEVYAHILLNGKPGDLAAKRKLVAAEVFPFMLANSEAILNQFQRFETSGRAVIEKLVSGYPDENLSQIEVLALPSLLKFNGKVTELNGKVYVLFGMDFIVKVNQQPDFRAGAILVNDLPVLMAHEFTHALHFEMSEFGQSDDTSDSFFAPLWQEGVAEVNSQLLNPGTDLESVYMEKVLAQKCTPENLTVWAKAYLQDSKGSDAELEAAYPKWFLMSEGLAQFGTDRAGYCLGYNVVLSALREKSMHEVLKMNRGTAYSFIKDTLAAYAAKAP